MAPVFLIGPPNSGGESNSENPEVDEADAIATIYQSMNINAEDGKPPMGLTENSSPTFLSTGNPCLDFFFHVVPDTPPDELIARLELSWAHDPLTTLKLICNLRGVRGTGKSDRENFYMAAFWLYKNHPKTLSFNARNFADFGYFKDLPEILYRIIEGPLKRKLMKEERKSKRLSKRRRFRGAMHDDDDDEDEEKDDQKEKVTAETDDIIKKKPITKEEARVLRKEREAFQAKRALEKYKSDSKYRLYYDSVCDVFAGVLKSDIEHLKANELTKISLAAKWCPSIDSSYDRTTLICEGIARRVFPRESDERYADLDEAHYVYKIRDRLRKEVLVPLHKVLELPEVYMSANEWNILPYGRVPSVAMKNYKKLFEKHDSERFHEYLNKVKRGEAKIAAGALLPHEIVKSVNEDELSEVGELQWKRMVEDMSKKGKLSNCIAVCDVSGSMSGTPMEVCVALGILVSELSEEPWKGQVITFSENPQFQLVQGDTLKAKSAFVQSMDWGMNTDFQKVFDSILDIAEKNNLSEDQLIKRIFVFSDMEFDCAHSGDMGFQHWEEAAKELRKKKWETDYEVIQRKYKEHGYNKVPEMVFWNLRDSVSTPVVAKQAGVAMVSGFSKNLLTLFLEKGGIVDSEDVMRLALAGAEYNKLALYD